MDDVPAGPASPGPRRPPLSVVIPVHNGGRDFERCLRRLRDSTRAELRARSSSTTARPTARPTLAESFGAGVVRNATRARPRRGPERRGRGRRRRRSSSSSTPTSPSTPTTLARAVARFDADPGLAALFGSYDDAPAAPGLVSQFRNLLHHYVHQQGEFVDDARPAHTFWTGCGAIRRDVFLDLGGFDPQLYRRPAIEDIELGYRLTRAGYRIVLARDVQATHLKRWTLPSVVRTDIFQRGVPWMLLMKRSRVAETDLNVEPVAEGLRRGDRAWRSLGGRSRRPGRPGSLALLPAGPGGDRRAEPRLLPVPGPSPGLALRGRGRPAALTSTTAAAASRS